MSDEIKIPATIGACVDELYQLRERRLAAQHEVDELERAERQLRDHVLRTLEEQGATAVAGSVAKGSVTKQQVGTVKDWDTFYAHIVATGDFSLMQRRVNDGALRERWEAGEVVPGVEAFPVFKLNLTKVR